MSECDKFKPGDLAYIKITGDIVIVMHRGARDFHRADVELEAVGPVYTVRRAFVKGGSEVVYVLDTFCEFELEFPAERAARRAKIAQEIGEFAKSGALDSVMVIPAAGGDA